MPAPLTLTLSVHLCLPAQANKNVLLKGQVSLQSASLAAVFKSWWQPAFTLAGAASYDFATGRPRYGLTVAVETFKNIRCAQGRGGACCLLVGLHSWPRLRL